MANQDDFEKLISDMHNAETVNEALNTMVTGLSMMLTADMAAAKKLFATDQQLQSLADTQVNLDAHMSEMLTILGDKAAGEIDPNHSYYETRMSIAERLAAGPPRSAAHAAVQGSRGAEVIPPAPTPFSSAEPAVVNPAELSDAETMSDIAKDDKHE